MTRVATLIAPLLSMKNSMKNKTLVVIASLIWCLNFGIGCSSDDETGSDYVPPDNESPEEEGPIEGDEE